MTCATVGCAQAVKALGLCLRCYQQLPERKARARELRAAWELRNKDKVAVSRQRHKAKHREAIREKDAVYRAVRRDQDSARTRAWYLANREHVAELARKRHEAEPEARRAKKHNRRAKVSLAGGSCSPTEWGKILKRYNHTCPGCGETEEKLTVDHVVPVALGGTSNPDNLQPLCRRCNSRKGKKTVRYEPWGNAQACVGSFPL
jgi:5-methylcytosine-specific restriction endonuclease McrA